MVATGKQNDRLDMVIVGAGRVGSTTAFAALTAGIADTITLVDHDPGRAEGEAMDLAHGLPFAPPTVVKAAGFEACRDADVVVIAAGAARQPGDTRLDLAKRNLDLFRSIVPQIVAHTRDALFVIVSNPVDVLTLATQRLADLPPCQVVGSGTILDTARLRTVLSQHFCVAARNVHAYVVGEHGDSQVMLWSQARIGGLPLDQFSKDTNKPWSSEVMHQIQSQVQSAGAEVIRRKGATHYAIGLAASRLARAILRDERTILTVSTPLEGQHGLRDVALSLPCIVGRHGRLDTLSLSLDAEELAALTRSAQALSQVYRDVGGP